MKLFAQLFLIFCLLLNRGYSQIAQSSMIPSDTTCRYGKLENGFTYYIKKNSTPANEATLRLVVAAGKAFEDPDQLGLAHLLEHVAFNGTKHYPNNSLMDYFNSVGFIPGNNWNASTNEIYTDYFINVPLASRELYDNALQIIRDWSQSLQLDPKEIDDERGVVLSEYRGNSDALFREEAAAENQLISGHPRYPADWREKHDNNIKNFKHESLIRFYQDWYRPDLQAVIIVGNIDVDETEAKVREMFSDLTTPRDAKDPNDFISSYAITLDGRGRFVASASKERTNSTVKIYRKAKAASGGMKTLADFKQSLIRKMYTSMVVKRFRILKEANSLLPKSIDQDFVNPLFGMLSQAEALLTQISIDPSQSIQSGIKAAMAEIYRLSNDGFTLAELEYQKQLILDHLKNGDDFSFTNGMIAQKYQDNFLKGTVVLSAETEKQLSTQMLREISLADINQFARPWIGNNANTDIIILTPGGIKAPEEIQVRKWLAEAKKMKFPKFVMPDEVTGPFVKPGDLPVVKKEEVIHSISGNEELSFKEVQFNNGIRLILKKQQHEGTARNSVFLTAVRAGGASLYDGNDYLNASQASQVIDMNSTGTGKFNGAQLKQYLLRKNMKAQFVIRDQYAEIKGSAKNDDLDLLFQLLYVQMVSPKKDEQIFNKWREARKKRIIAQSNVADSVFNTIEKFTYKNQEVPLKQTGLDDLDKLNFERMYDIFKKEFSNPSGYTFFVTGEFVEPQLIDLFIKYFGGFKSEEKKSLMVVPKTYEYEYDLNKTFYSGQRDEALVRLHFPGKYQPNLKSDLILKLLGYVFDVRIRERLREKEGGSYNPVGGGGPSDNMPGNYIYYTGFGCAVDNVEKMIAAAREEVDRLKKEGIDEDDLLKAKQRQSELFKEQLRSEYFWNDLLKSNCLKPGAASDFLKSVGIGQIITVDEVSDAAKCYFTDENMMQFVVMPEHAKK